MNFDNIFDLETMGVNEETDVTTDWLQEFASKIDPKTERTDAIWAPQKGPQEMAFYSDADELFYGGAAGGGKQAVIDALIATPFGWKRHGDIKVGDQVSDPLSGGVSRVIGVFPQGVKKVCKVIFSDGASVRVGPEHLWAYWLSGKKLKADRRYPVQDEITGGVKYVPQSSITGYAVDLKVGTTEHLIEHLNNAKRQESEGKRPNWPLIPLTQPVRYTRPTKTRQGYTIRIDPYLLGLLIGDGSITPPNITIGSVDQFIIDEVIRIYGKDRTVYDGKINIRLNDSSELKKELDSYGLLGTKSDTKFIPENYLYADIETRFNLMQGLIDTDGYVDNRGHVSYTTVSEQLAKNIQYLARSLGASANITQKQGAYKHHETGERIECKIAYTVWMQGEHADKFMRLPRKKERYKPYNGGIKPGRRVVDITEDGEDECVCILVDALHHLYITDDFIVTHNTDLMIGLATSELSPHKKAIMFRKTYGELKDVVVRTNKILEGTGAEFRGGNQMRFDEIPGGKSLELGSANNFDAAQKYKGRPHDLKLFDEVSDFDYSTYTFLIGWARSAEAGIPVRIVAAGNPPTNSDGEWVIRRWGPWLDPTHVNPAEPGELRWFSTLDGEDREITPQISEAGSRGKPFDYLNKLGETETIYPQSRTFIPAKLDDNEFLGSEYRARLQSQPEPYRSQLLYGDFGLSMKPDPWQTIPTQWVNLAFNRWDELSEQGEIRKLNMVTPAYGLDVAEGGNDLSSLAKVAGNAVLYVEYTNEEDTMKLADWVVSLVKNRYHSIGTDAIQIGVGPSDRLRQLNYRVYPIKVTKSSTKRDRTGQFEFMNMRTELWWRLREALDPNNNEYPLAIPRSRRLLSELTAPKFGLTQSGKLNIQKKIEIRAKLGFSTDGVDAILLALHLQRMVNNPLRMF